ncbi:nucleotide exchange factor GrpE [Thiocystis minor]|uniref:nucleotide exchange factor GrpE n=1 Tax=Thiocystis minor TaxID=61597 RepID=UPI001913200C|nr:nucleotide exchange factor GrpE [Thiocystis minor]MBK5966366.1 nucleotide exchange factor GrpE [Thiocystis minor]
MDEAEKDQLTARFRAYLDARSHASVPFDSAQETSGSVAPDLFTLLAELVALKNEVKLESRQVKSALDEFRSLFDTLRETNARLSDEQERHREQDRKADQQGQKNLLLELLELRDRLQAGLDQARRFQPGWFDGRASGFVASMAEGMRMNLRRFDETLARRGVRELPALGQSFDPHTMHAAELARNPLRPEGVVVGELRKGFFYQDRLLRPAEVVVNRPRGRTIGDASGAPPPGVWPLG